MKYRVRWRIEGTTFVDAEDEDEASGKFDDLEPSELIEDLVSTDIYDIEEWGDRS